MRHLYHEAFLVTPVTAMMKPAQNKLTGPCRDFEYRTAECVYAYGFYRGLKECSAFMEDLMECHSEWKRHNRSRIIHGELSRQRNSGERSKEYEKPTFNTYI